MNVLDKIEKLRLDRGWSVYRLAEKAGITDKCIYNWYNRNTMPSIETIEKICEAFGMTLSQFFAEGNLIEVDEELKELFDDWRSLTEEQKKAVKVMINIYGKMSKKHHTILFTYTTFYDIITLRW